MRLLALLFRIRRRPRPRPRQPAPPPVPRPAPAPIPGPSAPRPRAEAARYSLPAERPTISGYVHVIDGDTIDIRGHRIRLFGIDAPEIDHPYGIKSKWALVHMVKRRRVHAEVMGLCPHGRTVALCRLEDGRDLSAELVRIGLAVDWPKYSGGRYRHLEPPGIRRKLWRCDARQKGRMPPPGVSRRPPPS